MTDDSAVDQLAGVTRWKLIQGNCLETLRQLPDRSIQMCVTSPPYFCARDYKIPPTLWPDGTEHCLGAEPTPDLFVAHLVAVFREVRRALVDDGTLWLNLGDGYNTIGKRVGDVEPKNLFGVPWLAAFALRADGWFLRSDIIWHKPHPMAESIRDRPTKAHEYIFLLSKSRAYYYDLEAIREDPKPENEGRMSAMAWDSHRGDVKAQGAKSKQNRKKYDEIKGANRQSVWSFSPVNYPGAHCAVFPPELPRRCIMAGSKPGDTVLDCFNGTGTSGEQAVALGRLYIGLEQNPGYVKLSRARLLGVPKAELKGALAFCPGCEAAGRTKLIETTAIDRARASGRKVTCMSCMTRYTVEELLA